MAQAYINESPSPLHSNKPTLARLGEDAAAMSGIKSNKKREGYKPNKEMSVTPRCSEIPRTEYKSSEAGISSPPEYQKWPRDDETAGAIDDEEPCVWGRQQWQRFCRLK